MPISVDKVQVRPFSTCITFKEERVTSGETDIAVESISGFVTCLRDGQWWLACVLQVHVKNSRVKLTLFHPHGPSNAFKYPAVRTCTLYQLNTYLEQLIQEQEQAVLTHC